MVNISKQFFIVNQYQPIEKGSHDKKVVIPVKLVLEGSNRGTGIQNPFKATGFPPFILRSAAENGARE